MSRSEAGDPASTSSRGACISADSHPVSGTYSFRVGPGAAPSVERLRDRDQRQEQRDGRDRCSASRAVGVFTGLALLIGGVVFLVLIARGTSAARVDPAR